MIQEMASRLAEPTARGLAGAVSRAIGEGALSPGSKLPPIRTVAAELSLSPTTVSAAWQLLARSGAIHTDGRRGTVVAVPRATGPRRYRRALAHHASFTLDLSTGVPDPHLLPDLGPALGRLHATPPSSYLDEPILAELESLLRRSWPYPPERLAIVDGAMDALDLVASSSLRLGDRAVVEDPCFPPLLDLLDAMGVEVIGVRLDRAGPVPDALAAALTQRPSAVFLQPRAQNPTGLSWTARRAHDLSAVLAGHPDVIVIEDDSAGDVASAPLYSIGESLPHQTVHIRSFAKSHGPDLRIAALGGPASILDPVLERRLLGQGWTSRLLQHLLLDLLSDPTCQGQVTHAREEYARRRRLVSEAIRRGGASDVTWIGTDPPEDPPTEDADGLAFDGINLWLPVLDEQAALISLASEGVAAAAGAAFFVEPPAHRAGGWHGRAETPTREHAHPGGRPQPDHRPHLRVTVGLVAAEHDDVGVRLARAAQAGQRGAPR
jgi:DNA-binding transcriptional MocR family regulator